MNQFHICKNTAHIPRNKKNDEIVFHTQHQVSINIPARARAREGGRAGSNDFTFHSGFDTRPRKSRAGEAGSIAIACHGTHLPLHLPYAHPRVTRQSPKKNCRKRPLSRSFASTPTPPTPTTPATQSKPFVRCKV